MNEVKRYFPAPKWQPNEDGYGGTAGATMKIHTEGGWVEFADYEAATNRAEAAERVAATDRMMCEQMQRHHDGTVEAFKRAGFTMGEDVPEGRTLGPVLIDRLRERAEAAERRAEEAESLVARMVRHGEGEGGYAVGRQWFDDARAFLAAATTYSGEIKPRPLNEALATEAGSKED